MGNRDTDWRTTTTANGINSQGIFQLLSHSLKCYISFLLQSFLLPRSTSSSFIIHPTLKLLIGYVGGLAEPLIPREFSAEADQETLYFLLRPVCGGGNWKVFECELQRSKVLLGVSPDHHRASQEEATTHLTCLALHQSKRRRSAP